jgi:hypothetical protein
MSRIAFVGYNIDCKNTHGMNRINFKKLSVLANKITEISLVEKSTL